ncbi:uncharacterized protein B0T15DRAFT_138227 [Chaetomium strumarium]|uniref:Uncharacterized protein n=1 Tax=Chaetomium strumarium TaxID=1170767 RepID=A0AAJ0GUE6_9PEZI|nr:hypothetical protein B0T15DRAFT_138227 [Chaetomium strumarium]
MCVGSCAVVYPQHLQLLVIENVGDPALDVLLAVFGSVFDIFMPCPQERCDHKHVTEISSLLMSLHHHLQYNDLAGTGMAEDTIFGSPSPGHVLRSESASPKISERSLKAAVVGIAVGSSVAGLLILALLIWTLLRIRRRRREVLEVRPAPWPNSPFPFVPPNLDKQLATQHVPIVVHEMPGSAVEPRHELPTPANSMTRFVAETPWI